jgi:hypothetical protein
MARRGNDILEAAAARLTAQKEAQTITSVCGWCGETVEGPLRERRDAFREHVRQEHPEVKLRPPAKTKRRANAPRTLGQNTIAENIQNVRAQGGGGWASPGEDY